MICPICFCVHTFVSLWMQYNASLSVYVCVNSRMRLPNRLIHTHIHRLRCHSKNEQHEYTIIQLSLSHSLDFRVASAIVSMKAKETTLKWCTKFHILLLVLYYTFELYQLELKPCCRIYLKLNLKQKLNLILLRTFPGWFLFLDVLWEGWWDDCQNDQPPHQTHSLMLKCKLNTSGTFLLLKGCNKNLFIFNQFVAFIAFTVIKNVEYYA